MKKLKIILIVFVTSISMSTFAQNVSDYIDVVHLKNGSIIKGVIIEQIPAQSVRIKTQDGSEYVYQVAEVEKYTREVKEEFVNKDKDKDNPLKYMNNFKRKEKGYFFEAEALYGSQNQGLRIINGYRFSQYAKLGVAIGLENTIIRNSSYFSGYSEALITANLVFSGDLLNKRITPFYQAELGYGITMNRGIYYFDSNNISVNTVNYGGPMASTMFGVKFKTKKKIEYKLGLDLRMISNFSDINQYKEFNMNPSLGIRFGIGF